MQYVRMKHYTPVETKSETICMHKDYIQGHCHWVLCIASPNHDVSKTHKEGKSLQQTKRQTICIDR